MEDDGSIPNGADALAGFYDAEPNGDVSYEAAVTVEDEEVRKLRKQVELLSDDMKASKSTIDSLDAQIAALAVERDKMALQIKELQSELKGLGAVAARAAELEGEVARLQHDLVLAMSGGEELADEAEKARRAVEEVRKEKAELAAKVETLERRVASLVSEKAELNSMVLAMSGRVTELEGLVKRFEEEREKADAEREDEVRELVEKLETAVKESKEKDELIKEEQKRAADAKSELEELRKSMLELKASFASGKAREADVEAMEKSQDEGGMKYPWTVALMSTGAVAAAATLLCLHYSKIR